MLFMVKLYLPFFVFFVPFVVKLYLFFSVRSVTSVVKHASLTSQFPSNNAGCPAQIISFLPDEEYSMVRILIHLPSLS